MKFSVNRDLWTAKLQTILAVVSSRTTLPILGNVLLKAEDDALSMAATDLDISVSCSVAAQVGKGGSTTVPARMLAEMVRELPDEDVTVSVSSHRMEIKSGRGVYRISGMSPDEFPRLPAPPAADGAKIPADQLKNVTQRTLYAASTDDTRPALNGVLWQANGKETCVVATDGHRLARVALAGQKLEGLKGELIIPPKALSLVLRVIDDDTDAVTVIFGEKNVVFKVGDMVITSRLIEGPYPNYKQVIPDGNDKILTVDSESLAAAVRRVAVLSNSLTHQVRFSLTKDTIELSATNQDVGGEARETVACKYDRDDLEIGYNANYILDILKNFGPGDVIFKLGTSISAGVIEAAEEAKRGEYLCLVMPLRLAD